MIRVTAYIITKTSEKPQIPLAMNNHQVQEILTH